MSTAERQVRVVLSACRCGRPIPTGRWQFSVCQCGIVTSPPRAPGHVESHPAVGRAPVTPERPSQAPPPSPDDYAAFRGGAPLWLEERPSALFPRVLALVTLLSVWALLVWALAEGVA